jgi:hypothetical protein
MAVPFAIKLSEKAELELMTEYDFIHNEQGSGYHVEFLNSGSLTYDWTSVYYPPILRWRRCSVMKIPRAVSWEPEFCTTSDTIGNSISVPTLE